MTVATDKIMAAKMLKAARLDGFRIHKVEHEGIVVVALITVGEWALTARLKDGILLELSIGWPL